VVQCSFITVFVDLIFLSQENMKKREQITVVRTTSQKLA